ncbi:MAG: hypothetical protein V9F01_09130 [Chitinophagaceae bacterium]
MTNLENSARSLGAAFQKVNFLRDIKADFNGLVKDLFSQVAISNNFTEQNKRQIEEDIHNDFRECFSWYHKAYR